MAENTKIEWCDATINIVQGCTKVSEGCRNCYAARDDARHLLSRESHWGPGAPRHVFKGFRGNCIRLNRKAEKLGRRLRVFPNSYSDVFDPEWPIEVLAELFDVIRICPWLDFLLLTKRPELWLERLDETSMFNGLRGDSGDSWDVTAGWGNRWANGTPPHNVWIGASIENQKAADERIPHLLRIPAKVRFLSCEPLLGPVDLSEWIYVDMDVVPGKNGEGIELYIGKQIHQVILGGESGPNARPMHPDWPRSLRDQCQAAEVPFFFKQWGEWLPMDQTGERSCDDKITTDENKPPFEWSRVGKKAAGRLLDGREWNEFTEVTL